jgi:hypothetical protein
LPPKASHARRKALAIAVEHSALGDTQDRLEKVAAEHALLPLLDGPDHLDEDIVPRIVLAPRLLLGARAAPQLGPQHDRRTSALPLCRLSPQLIAVALERWNVDGRGLNRPEAPIRLLQILVVVRRRGDDAAPRLIATEMPVGLPRAVVGA